MPSPAAAPASRQAHEAPSFRQWLVPALIITALFGYPLYLLVRLSLKSELHSHLLLIPAVSFYLWRFVDAPVRTNGRRSWPMTVASAAVGTLAAATFAFLFFAQKQPVADVLWLGILSYLLCLLSAAFATVGSSVLSAHAFACAFLLFFLPLPPAVTDGLSRFLQVASAEASDWTLRMVGLSVLRDGMVFQMPGLTIQVAEECSGVRSTLMLFITSVVAGRMFLKSPAKRAILALATFPVGILRNAVRITSLSWLTVNVDSEIINGPLHHQGGPVFFILSLLPFFALLWWFRKSESAQKH
jgi:exosortase C (VPDSG-CTERM-specific)